MMMRFSLLADTVAPRLLMNASGFQRLTMDVPRIVGAFAGAGIMAAFGVGPAYAGVAAFYLLATRSVSASHRRRSAVPSCRPDRPRPGSGPSSAAGSRTSDPRA